MARKSANALSVAPATELDRRPPPPADLTQFEAQVWVSITNTKPADWFQADCLSILHSHCKHISHAATLDQKISEFDPSMASESDWAVYLRILDARAKQTNMIAATATKLRLTPQSRYDTRVAANKADKTAKARLWDRPETPK